MFSKRATTTAANGYEQRHEPGPDARRRRASSEVGDAVEHAGDHPDDDRQSGDPDAEQRGAVRVFGHGAHGDARTRVAEEHGDADEGDDTQLDGEQVLEAESQREVADLEVETAEGKLQLRLRACVVLRLGPQVELREERQAFLEREQGAQHRCPDDCDDGQEQARRVEEAQHEAADDQPQHRRDDDAQQDRHREGHAGEHDEVDGELRADGANDTLREVDDAQRAVDKDESDAVQRRHEACHEPAEQDRRRRSPAASTPGAGQHELGYDEERGDRAQPQEGRSSPRTRGQQRA
jgi:hypothetical protein